MQIHRVKHKFKRGTNKIRGADEKNALQETKTNASSSNALQIEKRCKARNDENQENTCKRKTLHKESPQRKCSKPAGGAQCNSSMERHTGWTERKDLPLRDRKQLTDDKLQRGLMIVTTPV
ncbi:hypothetical protein NL108_012936 [Boleophthalmus pectinirostris]|nr:hypothetical protein NL108_006084 [Boleophthalmus pectinirostris]KAJ0060476.1 hypothetical protein NL108_012936 [Boleophthalmus pectinirostris]